MFKLNDTYILLHSEYICRRGERDETTNTRYCDLGYHILLLIRSPDHGRYHRREDECKPEHSCCEHRRKCRDGTYDTGKSSDHEKCGDEFREHELPHTFHRFFHFGIIEAIFAMMDLHPEFPEEWSVPDSTKSKRCHRHNDDREPVKRGYHKKKIKRIKIGAYFGSWNSGL